jgi:hypothetical protein
MARRHVPLPASWLDFFQLSLSDQKWLTTHETSAMEALFNSYGQKATAHFLLGYTSQKLSEQIQQQSALNDGRIRGGINKREVSGSNEKKIAAKILWQKSRARAENETIESFADRVEYEVGVSSSTLKKWVIKFRKE